MEEREVRFDIWCKRCKHKDTPEVEDPCNECLNEPSNINSRKPIHWKDAD